MKPSQLALLLQHAFAARAPVLITGGSGIGKSDIVAQGAAGAAQDLIIDHPAVSDPTAAQGIPWGVDGDFDFRPVGFVKRLVGATRPTVAFIDDLGQAPEAVQKAYMQLLLARRVGDHIVPDCVTFVAATNRRTDRAGVTGILDPVKSRFWTIVALDVHAPDWVRWAIGAGMPTPLILFIDLRPDLLFDPKPTNDLVNTHRPRTVANVGRLMAIGLPAELEYEAYSGAAGEAFAAEFCGFLKIWQTLPNPNAILLDPDTEPVPRDPATMYAITGALAHKASDNTFGRIIRYYNRLPDDFAVLGVKLATRKCPQLKSTRAYIEWTSAHPDVLL